MADNTLNISSDDAAIFSTNSTDASDDMDDGEDPTNKLGQSRAGSKAMFRANKARQTPLRQTLSSGQVPVATVRLTPGANNIRYK